MSRILVTGVDGFTGRYLAPALAAEGHEVHGLVQRAPEPDQPLQPGVHALHACDLLDPAGLLRMADTVRPDKVAHLAGIAFVGHGDVGAIYGANLIGVRHLLAALASVAGGDAPPSAVLLASSANVYGNSTAGVIDESVPAAPTNDYAVSKLAMEYMAATWQTRLPITVVRPFNYTGVGQSEDFLLPKIVAHFRRRAVVLELGNLDVERDFSDVRTVVDCYARLLRSNTAGEVFNVCSGVGHTLRAVLQMTADIAGHMPELRINPAFVRDNEVQKLVGSRAAPERAIGAVKGPGLRDTLRWMLA